LEKPFGTGRRGGRLAILAAIILSSCQAQVPAPSRTPGPTTELSPNASSEPARQLDVTINRDPLNSSKATIGQSGGSLTLDLGSQTKATLSVPPFALLGPTEITMTAAAVRDWPDAPPDQAAVQLEPDGLELFVRATLTFEQPAIGPDGTHGEIGWSGQGRGLHAVLAAREGDAIQFDVDHFSGYGLTWNIGTADYWSSWGAVQAEGAAADINNDLAALLGLWRQQELVGLEHKSLDEVLGYFVDRWYDNVFEPAMRAGETTCEGGRMALTVLNTMSRLLQLAGLPPEQAYKEFLARRQPGQSMQFAFDTIPADYVTGLTERCDGEALEQCRATGDITLLLIYLRDRAKLVDLAGLAASDTGEGLVEACARYRLEADFIFSDDRILKDTAGGTPGQERRDHWEIKVRADLTWHQVPGQPPWVGTIEGTGTPTVTKLESRLRSRNTYSTDYGDVDLGWLPWCDINYQFGPWDPWRVELTSLAFRRERITHRYQLPMMEVPLMPSYAIVLRERTIEVEGPLRTVAFLSGRVLFDELKGTNGSYSCSSEEESFRGPDSAEQVIHVFQRSQPPFTSWERTAEGLGPQEVELSDATVEPFTAKRDWSVARVVETTDSGYTESNVKHEATITLTHSPG
jgi:hypothetical protein